MTFRRMLAVATVTLIAACAPKNPPMKPASPTRPQTSVLLPRSPDVSHEVMGYLVISDGARLAQQLSPDQPNADPRVLQTQLLASMGIAPDLAATIDLKRPLGV